MPSTEIGAPMRLSFSRMLCGFLSRVEMDSIGLRSNLPLNSMLSTLNFVSTSSIAAE